MNIQNFVANTAIAYILLLIAILLLARLVLLTSKKHR